MTKTIAITGGIGSGKSTFCSKLKEKGFKIHSSDEQVAKIYKKFLMNYPIHMSFDKNL